MKVQYLLFVSSLCLASQLAFAQHSETWKKPFADQLPALGHRNRIVIADSAYPAQTSPGIKVILADSPHRTVVRDVLASVEKAPHVRPMIRIDKELPFVEEQFASGIERFRKLLNDQLKIYKVKSQLHEHMLAKLSKDGESYRILVIKNDLDLLYTSVFIELDAGYWSPEAEKSMRRKMGNE